MSQMGKEMFPFELTFLLTLFPYSLLDGTEVPCLNAYVRDLACTENPIPFFKEQVVSAGWDG